MKTEEFQNYLSQITPLLTGSINNKEEVVSALEILVNDPDLQQPHAENITTEIQRKYLLATATPETNAYRNLHMILRDHSKSAQIYTGIANLWAAEACSAQAHYDTEDELFKQNVARGYFPSTPYEQWFVTGTDREIGGIVDQQQRTSMRAKYLQYCKEREVEYRSASQ